MKTLVILVLSFTVLLVGCEDTTFESEPSEEMSKCDPGFVGNWRLMPTESSKENNRDDELFVVVEPGCKRWRFIEKGVDDAQTSHGTHVSFGKVARMRILAVQLDDDNASVDVNARWKNGFLYFRYDLRGNAIDLYPVENPAVARLILDGQIQGRVEKISAEPGERRQVRGPELHNFVAGKPHEMARVVQMRGVFQDKTHFTLKPATDAEIFRIPTPPGPP